ncbi:hypothetical protein A7K73_08340 [Candidatus Methylacidiphilum fumarolicum]|nr:hypothetical protein A7K73_08340 [Candidatus Methylacidiphilum fumarolicum]TFE76288.1 hypothetical protein A7D33_10130 [Candidatus Methylacidiphilum fumarolicum]
MGLLTPDQNSFFSPWFWPGGPGITKTVAFFGVSGIELTCHLNNQRGHLPSTRSLRPRTVPPHRDSSQGVPAITDKPLQKHRIQPVLRRPRKNLQISDLF